MFINNLVNADNQKDAFGASFSTSTRALSFFCFKCPNNFWEYFFYLGCVSDYIGGRVDSRCTKNAWTVGLASMDQKNILSDDSSHVDLRFKIMIYSIELLGILIPESWALPSLFQLLWIKSTSSRLRRSKLRSRFISTCFPYSVSNWDCLIEVETASIRNEDISSRKLPNVSRTRGCRSISWRRR